MKASLPCCTAALLHRVHDVQVYSAAGQFTVCFSLRACAIVQDDDVLCIFPVQVPRTSYISDLSRGIEKPTLLQSPRSPPSTFNQLDAACTDQGTSERAPASTTPSSLSFLFHVGTLYPPRRHNSLLTSTVHLCQSLSCSPLHSLSDSTVVSDSHSSANFFIQAQSTARSFVIRTCSFPTSRHCMHSRSRNL